MGEKDIRKTKDIVGILKEIKLDEESNKHMENTLGDVQIRMLDNLINDNLDVDERWLAYREGFQASEISRSTGTTRANISARVNTQLKGNKEEVKEEHKEKRKKLFLVRDWYHFVYLSDKVGDFRQMSKYLPERVRKDTYMFRKYQEHGGVKLDRDFVDKRTVLKKSKKNRILSKLEDKTIEQVAYEERVDTSTISRIAEESGMTEYKEESEQGEYEYTEKLKEWKRKKKERNEQEVEKRKKKREEEKGNKITQKESSVV